MKNSDFKNKTIKELKDILSEKRLSLRSFRFGVAGSKTRNVKEGMLLKRNIARIMTEINALKNKNEA